MTDFIHECNVCRGRFTDEGLLRTHVCPAKEQFISLDEVPETKLGNQYGGGDAAVAIGEHAFRAGFEAGAAFAEEAEGGPPSPNVDQAWSSYDPPEDIKALS